MSTTAALPQFVEFDGLRSPTATPPLVIEPAANEQRAYDAEMRRTRSVSLVASLLFHLALLLILAACLLPPSHRPDAPHISTTVSTEAGDEELLKIDPNVADSESEEVRSEQFFVVAPANGARSSDPTESRLRVSFSGLSAEDALESGGKTGSGKGSVGFFGLEVVGNSFVFIVDCSGSMKNYRFERARNELVSALRDLTPQQKFFVIFYNQAAIPMYLPGRKRQLVAATRSRVNRTRRWIKAREAGGGTRPDEALNMALQMKPEVIFFLTDGIFPRTARTVAQKANKHGTIIHTIALQFRGSEPLLKGIAEDHKGRYRLVE